jgi:hypothetical protein
MNIVLVPLIGPASENWIPAEVVHASCLDNFFRLFLPPPASEVRAAARADAGTGELDGGELPSVPALTDMRYPNGFLVVDRDKKLVDRIKKFVKAYVLGVAAPRPPNEAETLKYFLKLLHTKPVASVIPQESVVVPDETSTATQGSDIAHQLAQSLGGNCDAVIAFEYDDSQYQLRSRRASATPYTSLYRSCDTNLQQEALRRTWHWDRDADDHCKWLGISPPNLTDRNWRMIGVALAFESRLQLCDQWLGESLRQAVVVGQGRYRDEDKAFKAWAKKWLASLKLMLNAWKTSAAEVGNTKARTLEIWTAMDCTDLSDVGWHFIARVELFLGKELDGEVVMKVCSTPSRGTPEGRKAYAEMHPRHLIASTRAVQIDRGFDVLFEPRFDESRKSRVEELEHTYTEVLTQELSVIRFVQERWSAKGLDVLPRMPNPPLEWRPSMTRW